MSPFDIINNITQSKEYIYTEDIEKDIQPFITNRALSNFYDCVFLANEMNVRPGVSKKMLYDFYHIAIQGKKKRFSKWAKPLKDQDIMTIREYYGCNVSVAEQYYSIIGQEGVEQLRVKMYRGGTK